MMYVNDAYHSSLSVPQVSFRYVGRYVQTSCTHHTFQYLEIPLYREILVLDTHMMTVAGSIVPHTRRMDPYSEWSGHFVGQMCRDMRQDEAS